MATSVQLTLVMVLLLSSTIIFTHGSTGGAAATNTTTLIAPIDVSLTEYNITEFIILVSNMTTNNLTLVQSRIVLTNSAKIYPATIVSLRSIFILFNVWLLFSVIIFRNYEPTKSKIFYVVILTVVNILTHIQGILDSLPVMKLSFQSYWNKFILEKQKNSMDAQTFYLNNLDSKGFPTWMREYATFENSYCFINNYLLSPLIIMGIALYSIQILKLMLLIFMKDRVLSVEKYWEDFKEKQLESKKTMKMNQQTKNEKEVGTVKTPRSISEQELLNSASTSVNTTTDLSTDDTMSTTEEGIDEELVSLDGLSERGRVLNLLKIVIRYKIVEMSYIVFWGLITYVVLSVRTFAAPADTLLEPVFNSSWKSIAGYCNYTTRTDSSYYVLIMAALLFLIVPIFLVVDCIFSLVKYVKIRKENKKIGLKTENFFTYHFIETDPFVYRSESTIRVLFDILALILIFIFSYAGNTDGTVIALLIGLSTSVILHFFGATFSNPGFTIYKTYLNYIRMVRNGKSENNSEIQNLQQLMSSPVSSYSIDYVISRRQEREIFHQYLKQEFSVENLLFIEELNKLWKINERHCRAKLSKVKEIVKLYLSESNSVFEVNIPSKLIQQEIRDYRELSNLMNQHSIQLNHIPRSIKEGTNTRSFPQLEKSVEERIRTLLESICQATTFSTLKVEIYKNLMDSFYRFKHSRKWLEFVKSNSVKI